MPAIAVDQPAYLSLTDRHRRQASSHNLPVFQIKSCRDCDQQLVQHSPTVGAGLPAIAACQPAHVSLTERHRRQASSHNLPVFQIKSCRALRSATGSTQPTCGSWLACDRGVSASLFITDRPPSQASQLPQFAQVSNQVMQGTALSNWINTAHISECGQARYLWNHPRVLSHARFAAASSYLGVESL